MTCPNKITISCQHLFPTQERYCSGCQGGGGGGGGGGEEGTKGNAKPEMFGEQSRHNLNENEDLQTVHCEVKAISEPIRPNSAQGGGICMGGIP